MRKAGRKERQYQRQLVQLQRWTFQAQRTWARGRALPEPAAMLALSRAQERLQKLWSELTIAQVRA